MAKPKQTLLCSSVLRKRLTQSSKAMKKTFLFLAALSFSIGTAWASSEAKNALKIHSKSGTDVTILLDESPKVTFQDDDVIITTQKQVLSYPSSDVVRFTYETVDATGVHAVTSLSGIQVSFGEGMVSVSGLSSQTSVSLFSLDGKLLSSAIADKHGYATLSLPEIAGSVYVLKTTSLTLKIRKP